MAKFLVFLSFFLVILRASDVWGKTKTLKSVPFKIYIHRSSKNVKPSLQPIKTLPTYICHGGQAKKSLPKVEVTFSLTCPHCQKLVLSELKDLKEMAKQGKIVLLLYPVISNYVDYLMLYLCSRSGNYEQSIINFLTNQEGWSPADFEANDDTKKQKIHDNLCSCYSQNHHISKEECLAILNHDGDKDQLWVSALSEYLQHVRDVARPVEGNKEVLELPAIMIHMPPQLPNHPQKRKERVKNIDEAKTILQPFLKK